MPTSRHFTIQPASDEAYEDLSALFELCFSDLVAPEQWELRVAQFKDDLANRGWVAIADGKAVGFGTSRSPDGPNHLVDVLATLPSILLLAADGRVSPEAAELLEPDTGWMWWMPGACFTTAIGVTPEWRRRGVARALLEVRVEEARNGGARAVFATCVVGSHGEPLYRSAGFEPLLRLAGVYSGGGDAVVMGLRLGQPYDGPFAVAPTEEYACRRKRQNTLFRVLAAFALIGWIPSLITLWWVSPGAPPAALASGVVAALLLLLAGLALWRATGLPIRQILRREES